MDALNKQLRKGVLEILVLKMLSKQDYYGYFLIQDLAKKSHGGFTLKEGTLYPVLYRLEDQNLIKSYWEELSEGRSKPKKFYTITPEGQSRLRQMMLSWLEFERDVNHILGSS